MKHTLIDKNYRSKRNLGDRFSFRSLDLLGASFGFRLPTLTGKFQTKIGSLLTLLIIGCSIGLFVLLYTQYSGTSNPVVTQSTELIPEPIRMNLFNELMINTIAFSSLESYVPASDVKKHLTIKGYVVERSFIKEFNRFEYTSIQEFGYKPCTGYTKKESYRTVLQASRTKTLLNYLICPDLEDRPEIAEVISNPSGLSSKSLYIKAYPCSLADRTQCAPTAILLYSAVELGVVTSIPKPSNYSEPLEIQLIPVSVFINSQAKREYSYNIRRHRIYDVLNEYQSEKMRKEYLSATPTKIDDVSRDSSHVYCQESQISFLGKTCDEYFTIHHTALSEVITLRRNYKKLSELFGEFGGILKIASVLFIFYVVYNSRAKEKMLAKTIFGFGGDHNPSDTHQKTDKPNFSKEEQSSCPTSEKELNYIALKKMQESLDATNFIEKMCFMKFLREELIINEESEPLLSLINLKQLVQKKKQKLTNLGDLQKIEIRLKSENQQQKEGELLKCEIRRLVKAYLESTTQQSIQEQVHEEEQRELSKLAKDRKRAKINLREERQPSIDSRVSLCRDIDHEKSFDSRAKGVSGFSGPQRRLEDLREDSTQ